MMINMGYGLDSKQKEFIRQKVRQLGSINVVNRFYSGTSSVDEYARHIASETYSHYNSSIPWENPTAVVFSSETRRKPYQESDSITKREDYLAALERKKERDKQTGGIPEYEEGFPKTEMVSREDHKKMRARDYGDMKRRQNE